MCYRWWRIVLPLLLVLGLTACGRGATTAVTPTLRMGLSTFEGHTNWTITAGTAIQFTDDVDGAEHLIGTGINGTLLAQKGAPAQLTPPQGTTFMPGQSLAIVFATPGTYLITCTQHPAMNATITVQ